MSNQFDVQWWKRWETWATVGTVILAMVIWGWQHSHKAKPVVKPPVTHRVPKPKPHKTAKGRKPAIIEPVRMTGKAIVPKMPLAPTAKGSLSGWTIIVDPGHGGIDCGSGWMETFSWSGQKTRFYEASYTARMGWDLTAMLRAKGAKVYLTQYTKVMGWKGKSPQSPLPLPRDAQYATGAGTVSKSMIGQRARLARKVWGKGKNTKVVFVSLHIDGMPNGWKGAHVCYDGYAGASLPHLADLIGGAILRGKYYRRLAGRGAVRVMDPRHLAVIRHPGVRNSSTGALMPGNPIPQRVLIETGIPADDNDSYRLRDESCSKKLLADIVVTPICQLAAEAEAEAGARKKHR